MIISNILTTNDFSHLGATLDKLCKRIKQNAETLIDITTEPFGRGDSLVSAHNAMYEKYEFDQIVKGHTVKIYQTSTQDLLVVNIENNIPDAFIITKSNKVNDTNHVSGYTFKPFTDFNNDYTSKVVQRLLGTSGSHYVIEKVVGTSFREQPSFHEFGGELHDVNNVPIRKMKALLLPEPENPYDPNAIKVVAPLANGSAHHLGYIGKNGELYGIIKKPTAVELAVIDYPSVGNYAISYEIRYLKGE